MAYTWINLGDGRQVFRKVETNKPKRSHLSAPMINSDTMSEVQSMHDGKVYTSKSALRATYRAAGLEEVGNDPARLRPRKRPKIDRNAVKDSVQKAKARFDRGERVRAP
ncbi:hypothetical protein NKH47_17805 [Mesorhizobium sp. M1060]|uniref:hypothetical protein n=1 Tax=unclassified Mesorhizobium TaxID=325217 RepID=UPI0003CE1D88|nr:MULTISPECIES: hypothetical protein [unclassified Mesorhizobium]ESX31949.1 hypothetical protein X765_03745 [Mesorhizobium sp. LSHC440B00]ESX39335.1 hypothetical protein X763_04670 [Mesorhizobium sp. LSHC432A00]ESX44279.1 hypothetical protein X764_03690 [Mesorhizobium sp. LSHC440A00]WJI59299.1 hypothetical protein NLY33_11560 [Mesorhizobium sp. C432A]